MSQQNFGNLDERDFKIPMVSIGQPTSKSGKPGHLNFSTGESMEKLKKCSLVMPKKRRTLFGKLGEDQILCYSDDWNKPSARVEDPVSHNCHSCALSQWPDNMGYDDSQIRAKWQPKTSVTSNTPLCQEFVDLLLLDENKSPFILSVRGTNIAAIKGLNTKLKIAKTRLTFDISTEKKEFKVGLAYNLVIDNFNVMDDETEQEVLTYENAMGTMFLTGGQERKEIESQERPAVTGRFVAGAETSREIAVPPPGDDDLPF